MNRDEAIFHVALTYLRFNKNKKICPPAPSPKSCEGHPNNYFRGPKRCRVDVCSSDVIKIRPSETKIIIHDKLNLAVIFDIIYFLFTFAVLSLQLWWQKQRSKRRNEVSFYNYTNYLASYPKAKPSSTKGFGYHPLKGSVTKNHTTNWKICQHPPLKILDAHPLSNTIEDRQNKKSLFFLSKSWVFKLRGWLEMTYGFFTLVWF